MLRYTNNYQDRYGNGIAGAAVSVTSADTGLPVTIYSDNGLTPIPALMTDPSGQFAFHVADGVYNISLSKADIVTSLVTDVTIKNPLAEMALAAPTGLALIGCIQAGAGAVVTDLQKKLRDNPVTPQDFMSPAQRANVAAGLGTMSVVDAFENALLTGMPVYVPSAGRKYLFDRQLIVPSNSIIYGDQAQIILGNGVNQHVFRVATNATNVEIRGLRIDGNKANNTGCQGIAVDGGSSIRVLNNSIKNCSAAGIYFAGVALSGVSAMGNFVTGCVAGGITANDTLTNFAFNNNSCSLNGTHGVGIIGTAKHGTITGNVCWDNGQGTPTADNITGYNVANTSITVSGNACKGGLNNGIHMGGQQLIIANNVVYDATQYGIVMRPNTGVGDDCVMSGNVVYSAGVSGFWIENCNSGSVSGNVSRDNVGHGFAIDACANVAFGSNTARGNGGDGFRNGTASAWLTFSGNTAWANTGDGIELGNVTDSTISGNTFRANTGWGINPTGTEARNVIVGNTVRGNTAGQIAQPAVSTRVADNETGVSRQIASAAELVLPPGGSYFVVTGTTNITSMTASFAERTVTLKFNDVLTFTDGGNLVIAGNYVTAFNKTITLISDGSAWVEIARSTN
ncbi:right-handed parallel beta-helix repeat-containing protein [Massilia violaceinigra]|uniref:Right-handed parallel beta-helix repeat-containing protein n=1 Tax=Massilia violaceinigra TaxID=2045208 RepID=A0ABY4A525_9BURK|nr:right-handed parallel beta-helix repeat-containing protein [Massilia violaceinigra]UOD28784.1 right-handed parallel beta-helix repeat-containing protein [Massilia violaceinigra]